MSPSISRTPSCLRKTVASPPSNAWSFECQVISGSSVSSRPSTSLRLPASSPRLNASTFSCDMAPLLPLVPLGPARVARDGATDDLQVQQCALAPRRRDRDAEVLEHPVGVQGRRVVDRHPDQLLRGDRRGRLRDRAALAVPLQVGDLPVLDEDVHAQLVAAKRVLVLELEVVLRELPEVSRLLVVLQDVVAVELVHQSSKILRASCS